MCNQNILIRCLILPLRNMELTVSARGSPREPNLIKGRKGKRSRVSFSAFSCQFDGIFLYVIDLTEEKSRIANGEMNREWSMFSTWIEWCWLIFPILEYFHRIQFKLVGLCKNLYRKHAIFSHTKDELFGNVFNQAWEANNLCLTWTELSLIYLHKYFNMFAEYVCSCPIFHYA